ncbi:MAG: WecB/TagA/CpsF family glycosyltransferase [Candidatus Aminicenantes bacterium]|nr:WecB/TagA/CpsF family glycosyltransferase [Candidatus Aminicenantes bacterium]
MKKVNVLGINVTTASLDELNDFTKNTLKENLKKVILYTNIHGMNLTGKYEWMTDLFNRSDVVLCDGAGILWGSKILGSKIKERISLTDWGWVLSEILEETGHSLFLLGSSPDIVDRAVKGLLDRFPGLKISGSYHGFYDFEGKDNSEVINKINSSGTDVLLVGMGMPIQEKWILDNASNLNVKFIITCGAAFNYFAGVQKRCPLWISRIGLEWFHRFLHEPRRLFSRYFPGNFTFFLRIFRQKFSGKNIR